MDRQPDDMDRADVESLHAMTNVHLAASSRGEGAATMSVSAPEAPRADADVVAAVLADVQRAREELAQQNIVGPTRLAFPKRVMLRFSRVFTHRLVAAARALADSVEALVRVHHESLDEVERLGNSLRAQVTSVEIASQNAVDSLASSVLDSGQVPLSATASAVSRFESTVSLMDGRMAELEGHRERDRLEIQRLRFLVSRLAARVSTSDGLLTSDVPGAHKPALADLAVLDDSTYVQFERRFRGSQQEIKDRQLDALRFVDSIAGSPAPLLDLGCGRGEWLALLRDAGITAYGVDLSDGMVAEAVAQGLDARCADALEHLENLQEGSLQAVSAFHFAEHVPLNVFTRVLDAAALALRPGGLLLLETPNPTNLVVGSSSFYLDPTHLRPLPPDLLVFLVETRGFTDVELHYVHPALDAATLHAGEPAGGYDPRLSRVVDSAEWALFGPQDYVLLARRVGGLA